MQEVKFAKVHMFPYSSRERTRSALLPNKVPQEMIRERKMQHLHLSEQHSFDLRDRFVEETECAY